MNLCINLRQSIFWFEVFNWKESSKKWLCPSFSTYVSSSCKIKNSATNDRWGLGQCGCFVRTALSDLIATTQIIHVNYSVANIYLFQVYNRNTRKRCEIYSKLTTKTSERRHWRRSGVFIDNFEHILHLFLVFLLFILIK